MWLGTHTSTNQARAVAESFGEWESEGSALFIEIHAKTVSVANMDVSWISKFTGEEETLFNGNNFKFHVGSVTEEPSDKPDQYVVLEDDWTHTQSRRQTPKNPADFKKFADELVTQGTMDPEEAHRKLGKAKRLGIT